MLNDKYDENKWEKLFGLRKQSKSKPKLIRKTGSALWVSNCCYKGRQHCCTVLHCWLVIKNVVYCPLFKYDDSILPGRFQIISNRVDLWQNGPFLTSTQLTNHGQKQVGIVVQTFWRVIKCQKRKAVMPYISESLIAFWCSSMLSVAHVLNITLYDVIVLICKI